MSELTPKQKEKSRRGVLDLILALSGNKRAIQAAFILGERVVDLEYQFELLTEPVSDLSLYVQCPYSEGTKHDIWIDGAKWYRMLIAARASSPATDIEQKGRE